MDKNLMKDIIVTPVLPSILTRLDSMALEDTWLHLVSLKLTDSRAYERFVEATKPKKAIFHKLVIEFVDVFINEHGHPPGTDKKYKETLEEYEEVYKSLLKLI